jgi:hypothetical protein
MLDLYFRLQRPQNEFEDKPRGAVTKLHVERNYLLANFSSWIKAMKSPASIKRNSGATDSKAASRAFRQKFDMIFTPA